MRQSAIAQILATASADGEAFTLDIHTGGNTGWWEAKFLKFHYFQQENLLEIETRHGQHVYIDGDQIQAIKVNK